MNERHVVLVAPHFPPSNLAGGHRARLWSQHLHEFGWKPIIVTTHWDYYEEPLDWDLAKLVPDDLEIIRTKAVPTSPVRLVGDIGIRSIGHHYDALSTLALQGRMDFLHVTIPSNFSALLGPMIHSRHLTPYGIDYIDPWVHPWPGSEIPFSKAWLSLKLGALLEPVAVKKASLITGVAEGYYQGVLDRNPHLQSTCHTAAMPYGNSKKDFEAIGSDGPVPYLFDPADGRFHMIYAGALLPQSHVVLKRLLDAVAHLRRARPDIAAKLAFHFVGTGTSPSDPTGFNVQPFADELGLSDLVRETPNRIPYLDVLTHLQAASGILILGSTEAHYTPSKVYQSVEARRPIFGLFHEESTAGEVVRSSRAGVAIDLTETRLPDPHELAETLVAFIERNEYDPAKVDWAQFEAYSARESARALAAALDIAVAGRGN